MRLSSFSVCIHMTNSHILLMNSLEVTLDFAKSTCKTMQAVCNKSYENLSLNPI